mmetsp:Transcript_49/g.143  ORF Transcript_49/g.143 Transcript_49/m.143 type:complete len:175 (-) Transcript_49:396-920(-)
MRMSSSCVPRSTMRPFWMTTIWSESTMVERRWAITIEVRPTIRRSSASCTSFSFSESSADVASSRRRILGSLSSARAIAMRCFCPPLSSVPLSPHMRAIPSGLCSMNSSAFAFRAASAISASVASSRPYRMLSPMEVAKSTGSCETRLSWLRRCFRLKARTSMPSTSTCPDIGS